MKEKIQGKKALVLQSTLELISEQGFYGTPMSKIAKKANIAVGTIYLYFPTKEDLINTLYLDVKSTLANYVLKDYSEAVSIKENFIMLFNNVIHYFLEHQMEFIFLEQYSASPLITDYTKSEDMNIFGDVRHLFNTGKKENLIKELPTEVLITLVNGSLLSLAKLCLLSNDKLDESTLNASFDAIWDTISI